MQKSTKCFLVETMETVGAIKLRDIQEFDPKSVDCNSKEL